MANEDNKKVVSKPDEHLDEFSSLLIHNKIQSLEKDGRFSPRGILYLGHKDDEYKITRPMTGNRYSYKLDDKFFDLLINDKRVRKETLNYLLNPINNEIWYLGYPFIIQTCYEGIDKKGGSELLERVLETASKYNDENFVKDPKSESSHIGCKYLGSFGIVIITKKTILLALERGDYKNAKRFSNFNQNVIDKSGKKGTRSSIRAFVASKDDYRMSQIEHDTSLSEIDRHIQKSIHDGILNLKELIPVSYEQKLDEHGRPVNTLKKIKNDFVDKYLEQIIAAIEKYHIHAKNDLNWIYGNHGNKKLSSKELEEYEKNEKDKIISELRLEYQMYNKIDKFIPNYFDKLMKENRYRDVILDLCVSLETILRDKYKYEGSLMDMVKKLCSGVYGSHDIEWRHLSKLVRCRNNLVHQNNESETMKTEELEWCINYICKEL